MITRHAAEWASGEPGVFVGVPAAEYHASAGVNASHLKRLSVSPAHSQLTQETTDAGRRAMDLGTLCHGLVLERKDAAALGFAIKPDGFDGRTKEGKAWLAENAGKPIADADAIATASAVAAAVAADWASDEIAHAEALTEVSLRAVDPASGLTLKARFDSYLHGTIFDLKTCRDCSPSAFGKDCDEREYIIQAVHYMKVARLLGIDARLFRFVAASTLPPYEVASYDFDEEHPAWGPATDAHAKLLRDHLDCIKSGQWPKRRWVAQPVSLPRWSKYLPA